MLRYIHAVDLPRKPGLRDGMFRDRAAQFRERLGWEVSVSADGLEHDAYDAEDPLYVLWVRPDGTHGGSMRFLPTTGITMVNDHFGSLTDGARIESSSIWECTRFCLAPDAAAGVSAALMLGAMEVGRHFGLSHLVGVFDARMVRIYRRLGWGPTILGTEGQGRDAISAGLWAIDAKVRARLLAAAGVSDEVSRFWVSRSFGGGCARAA